MLCISFKLFIDILIKQHDIEMVLRYDVVYILQIVQWHPDKTTTDGQSVFVLCISFKLFIDILIKQLLCL